MRSWFQNLNAAGHRLFNFRGSLSTNSGFQLIKYEFCSGKDLRLQFKIKDRPKASLSLGIGFMTMYLTFPFFKFKMKNYKEQLITGFYVFDWSFVWEFMKNPFESSSDDPWYRSFYFDIPDFIFGKKEVLDHGVNHVSNVYFKIGAKEFKLDSVEWKRKRSFRRYIPYVLYHPSWYSVEIKCENPPQRSGKGENSWDCGDNGTHGVYAPWDNKPEPTWKNQRQCAELACKLYADGVLKDASRYGGSSSEQGINSKDEYVYVGFKHDGNAGAPT